MFAQCFLGGCVAVVESAAHVEPLDPRLWNGRVQSVASDPEKGDVQNWVHPQVGWSKRQRMHNQIVAPRVQSRG